MPRTSIAHGLSRRSFVRGAVALALAPLAMRLRRQATPEPIEERGDRMAELTALLLEIDRDYPELMPEIEAFTRAMARGDDPGMFRALLRTGAQVPEIAAKYA